MVQVLSQRFLIKESFRNICPLALEALAGSSHRGGSCLLTRWPMSGTIAREQSVNVALLCPHAARGFPGASPALRLRFHLLPRPKQGPQSFTLHFPAITSTSPGFTSVL